MNSRKNNKTPKSPIIIYTTKKNETKVLSLYMDLNNNNDEYFEYY